ncbi:MAG TPA: hypothetical protein VEK15_20470 [Vicinamibacteria bacterium]|nr:hypothetical protein [Vicinamibacteria bacterium]
MIVEFVGPPGAGKSTLRDAARTILRELGVSAMLAREARIRCFERTHPGRLIGIASPSARRERLMDAAGRRLLKLYRLPFCLHNRALTRHVFSELWRRPLSTGDRRKVLRFFLRDGAFHHYFGDHLLPKEALVLSEGLVHRVTSIHASAGQEPDAAWIAKYSALLPRSDLVISVRAPVELCAKRVVARGLYRRYIGNDLNRFLLNSARTIGVAVDTIRKSGWNVIEVRNEGSSPDGISALRSILELRYGSAGRTADRMKA